MLFWRNYFSMQKHLGFERWEYVSSALSKPWRDNEQLKLCLSIFRMLQIVWYSNFQPNFKIKWESFRVIFKLSCPQGSYWKNNRYESRSARRGSSARFWGDIRNRIRRRVKRKWNWILAPRRPIAKIVWLKSRNRWKSFFYTARTTKSGRRRIRNQPNWKWIWLEV